MHFSQMPAPGPKLRAVHLKSVPGTVRPKGRLMRKLSSGLSLFYSDSHTHDYQVGRTLLGLEANSINGSSTRRESKSVGYKS